MMQKIYNFFKEKREKGQSIIEYGILLAVIVTAVMAFRSNTLIDTQLKAVNSNIASAISAGADKALVTSTT